MAIEAHDNPEITSDEILIRRINPAEHVVPDENSGGFRLSTKAFSSSSELPYGMSVDVLGLMLKSGVDPVAFVTSAKYNASVHFSVGSVRSAGLWVGYHPLEQDGASPANPYHAEVWSQPVAERRFTKSQQRSIMAACNWFVELPGVRIHRK